MGRMETSTEQKIEQEEEDEAIVQRQPSQSSPASSIDAQTKRPPGLPASVVEPSIQFAQEALHSTRSSRLEDKASESAPAPSPTDAAIDTSYALGPTSPLLVPLVLLLAAFTVYLYPDRGAVVLLLLGVLATFGPTSEPVVRLMVDTMERVALQASRSPRLRALAMEQVHAALSDPFTQKKFSEACKLSMVESMADERSQAVMVSCMTKSMAVATVAASRDLDLQNTLNIAMRSGVAEALADETLVGTFFAVLKEGLKDPKLHQAMLKGAANAANPLKDMQNPLKDLQNPLKDLHNPLKDLAVPTLKPSNPLKAVQSTLKEAMVDAEAKLLANASGLTRDKPPVVQTTVNSPMQRPAHHPEDNSIDNDFHDVFEAGRSD